MPPYKTQNGHFLPFIEQKAWTQSENIVLDATFAFLVKSGVQIAQISEGL
jgi:hypothetical protein